MYLKWVKTKHKKNKQGKQVLQPYSCECYNCFNSRRKLNQVHDTKYSQDELIEALKDDKTLDAEFWTTRKNSCQGISKHQRISKVELADSKERYEDNFNEGTFEPLEEFADARMICFDHADLAGLATHVAERYPRYSVVYDKNNNLGVRIPDQQGGAYRWREGGREASTFRKLEDRTGDDLASAKEDFSAKLELRDQKKQLNVLHAAQPQPANEDETDDDPERFAAEDVATTVPNLSDAASLISSASTRPRGREPSRSVAAGSVRLRAVSAPSCRSRASTPGPAPRNSPRSSVGSAASPADEEVAVEDDTEDEDLDQPAADNKRMAKKDRLAADGMAALSSAQNKWRPEKHVSKCKQTKSLQRVVLGLRKWGRSNAAQEESDQNQQVSTQCFDYADRLDSRQEFLENVGSNFEDLANKLLVKSASAMQAFPAVIVANLITKGSQTLSDGALSDPCKAATMLTSLSMDPGLIKDEYGIGLHKVPAIADAAIVKCKGQENSKSESSAGAVSDHIAPTIVSSQNAGLLSHLEKIYKITDLQKFLIGAGGVVKHLGDTHERLALNYKSIEIKAENSKAISLSSFVGGFHPQLHIDLIGTLLLYDIGKNHSEGRRHSKPLQELAAIVNAESTKLSPRLRCYHNGIGFKGAPVKTIWKLVETLAEQLAAAPQGRSFKLTELKALIAGLRSAAALGDWELCATKLTELADGEEGLGEAVKEIFSHGDESEDPDVKTVSENLVEAVLSCVIVILRSQNNFSGILQDATDDKAPSSAADGLEQQSEDYWLDDANHPDDLALLHLVKAVCTLLTESGHPYAQLCAEAAKRAHTQAAAWLELRTTRPGGLLEKFRNVSALFREDLWLKSNSASTKKRPEESSDPGSYALQIFTDKSAESPRLRKVLCGLLKAAIVEGGSMALSVSRECNGLDGILPKESHSLVRAGRAFSDAEDVHQKVLDSKGVSIAELNETLSELSFAAGIVPDAATRRPGFAEKHELLTQEFKTAFDGVAKKVARVEAGIKIVNDKCANVFEACNQWQFPQETCGWAYNTKSRPDAALAGAAKNIESFATQFDATNSQMMRMTAKCNWMPSDTKKQLDEVAKKFETGLQDSLALSVKTLSHVYIVNSIFSQADYSDETAYPKCAAKWLDHIQRVLQYPPSQLNKVLLSKVTPSSKQSASPKTAKTAQSAAASTASQNSDAAAAAGSSSSRESDRLAGLTAAEPPKKRQKRFQKKDGAA